MPHLLPISIMDGVPAYIADGLILQKKQHFIVFIGQFANKTQAK